MTVFLFFLAGLLETIFAYYVFNRVDDHPYFLDVANYGLLAIPHSEIHSIELKSQISGFIYYFLMSPGRWCGGDELTLLIWQRFLFLLGLLACFSGLQKLLLKKYSKSVATKNRNAFMFLVLLYPGQLAWTSSLLRDGLASAFFFYGIWLFHRDVRVILSLIVFIISFCLRPEYFLIFSLLMAGLIIHPILNLIKYRIFILFFTIIIISISMQPWQYEVATFGQAAFGSDGMAYPLVEGMLDINGYGKRFIQALIDPIPLSQLTAFNIFGVAESIFFFCLLWRGKSLLRSRSSLLSSMVGSIAVALWIFSYFEVYVGGFSRHRLCLELMLIALLVLSSRRNRLLDKDL